MSTMPVISIVIASYNYGRFIEDAIRSVLDQSGFEQCELIVVDGGSTDDTVEILKKYNSQIAWSVSEKDNGQSDAFNKGFSHANGKYGCWLNADDILLQGVLDKVLNYLTRHPEAEWLSGSSVYSDKSLKVWKCSRCVKVWGWLGKMQPASPVNGPSSFFLLDDLRKVGGFDVNAHYEMDIDLWRKFQRAGIRLHQLKDYFWCFRCHEESKTSSQLTDKVSGEKPDKETYEINLRYGITPQMRRASEWINRFCRLITGMYLWSYIDTIRFRGKDAREVG